MVAELDSAEWISPTVRALRFALPSGSMAYEPGQWVNLFLPANDSEEGETLTRAYSLASAGESGGSEFLEFAITRVEGGRGSKTICELPVGSTVEVEGPFGIFTLARAEQASSILFVATGTGITPIRAMLQKELMSTSPRPVSLLFGCRRAEDVLFQSEFRRLANDYERFHYRVTLSQDPSVGDCDSGYVQRHLATCLDQLRGETSAEEKPHVFVCGLTEMVQGVRATLKSEHGYTRAQIHAERYD